LGALDDIMSKHVSRAREDGIKKAQIHKISSLRQHSSDVNHKVLEAETKQNRKNEDLLNTETIATQNSQRLLKDQMLNKLKENSGEIRKLEAKIRSVQEESLKAAAAEKVVEENATSNLELNDRNNAATPSQRKLQIQKKEYPLELPSKDWEDSLNHKEKLKEYLKRSRKDISEQEHKRTRMQDKDINKTN